MKREYTFILRINLANSLMWVVYGDAVTNTYHKYFMNLFEDLTSYIEGLSDSVGYPRLCPKAEQELDKC